MAHQFTQGGNVQGRPAPSPNAAGGNENILWRKERSPNFLYSHHPLRWEAVDGWWLPQLTRIKKISGVNNVADNGDMSGAIALKIRQGHTIIMPEDVGPYVEQYDGPKGPIFLPKWQKPRQIGKLQLDDEVDSKGFNEWRRGLVESGYLRPPMASVIEAQTAKLEKKLGDLMAKPHAPEGKVAQFKARLAAAKKAKAPKPKPARAGGTA